MSLLGYFGAALTSILVSIPTLHLLASVTHAPVLSFAARSIASFSALIFCACYGVVASILLRLVGYGGLSQWTTARAFKWVMWTLTGVEFVVSDKHGALKVRPGILIGNHQTYVSIPVLLSRRTTIDMASSSSTVNSTSSCSAASSPDTPPSPQRAV
jgi:lysophosphatidate acyltransferase